MQRHGRKLDHANTHQKKAGVVILILKKTGFNARKNFRDKLGHYLMIKSKII